jgi:Ca2+-binding RTX toxin-like protein
LLTLDGRTTGVINATAISQFSGTGAQFASFLASRAAGQITVDGDFIVVVNDGELGTADDGISIATLTALDALTTGTLTYATVRDTTTNLVANVGGYVTAAINVIVTDPVNLSQLATIDGYTTSGTLSVSRDGSDTGKITDTFANLLNDRLLNGSTGNYVTNTVPLVEIAVSATGVTVANALTLAGVTNIDVATGATVSISDSLANILTGISQINTAFTQAQTVFNVTGQPSAADLDALVALGATANNVSLALATISDTLSIEVATWVAQHGFTATQSLVSPSEDFPANSQQSIDVSTLNGPSVSFQGPYTYEGLLKGLLQAAWLNVSYTSTGTNDVLNLSSLSGSANQSGRTLVINVGTGNDLVTGTINNDTINGGEGNDSLNGSQGTDSLSGGDGNDSLSGGSGNDTLVGGAGVDTMTGGTGADIFVFATGDTGTISETVFDIITDYAVGAGGDSLDLVGNPATVSTDAMNVDVSVATLDVDEVLASVASGLISLSGAGANNVNTLGEWIDVARNVVTSTGQVAAFQFGSDTYVFQENGVNDLLIRLQGVTGIIGVGNAADTNKLFIA